MQLRVLAIALFMGATGFIMPRPSQSNNALNGQLQAAICGQNWYRAIQVIQNMKRISPRDAGRLAAYQSRLQALAERNVQLPDWNCSEGGLPSADSSAGESFTIPIVGRSGGIPVVEVTFNGDQTFPMLFDTGASTTFILPQMAEAMQARIVGEGAAVVADGRVIPTIIAEVDTLQVGDLTVNNAIVTYDKGSTGQNAIGLLGQSVYGEYDVLIGEDTIELRQRGNN